jgi:hypothetical protein
MVPLFVLSGCGSRDTATAPADSASSLASGATAALGTTSASGLTGTVSSLAGACPSLSFKLEGKVIKTSSATKFDGGACGDVKNGSRATIAGPTQSDGSITAEKLTLLAATTTGATGTTGGGSTGTTGGTTTSAALTITGGVHSLTGACPEVSFTLEGKTVRTNAATNFGSGGCASVKNDARVTITGTTQSDGRVLASTVTIVSAPPVTPPPVASTTVTITGTINGLTGSCPSVTFVLEGKTIRISAATTYERGSCAELRNAIRVTATGATQADGSIAATRVAFQL